LLFDTDGDGLSDRRETRSKRYDPRDTDSNDDGIDDRRDVDRRRREAARTAALCGRTCTP
jgi:hypothetical protein